MRTLKTLPGQFALHQFPLELLSLAIAPLSKVGFKVPWVAFATLDPPPMTILFHAELKFMADSHEFFFPQYGAVDETA